MNLDDLEIPSVNACAIKIIEACGSEKNGNQSIAEIAKNDPSLSSEILKISNSPIFGQSRKITSVASAINLLGRRSIKNIALCAAVKNLASQCSVQKDIMDGFWRASICSAVVASAAAEIKRLNKDDHFTLGIMLHLGTLVLLSNNKNLDANKIFMLPPRERAAAEITATGYSSNQVGYLIAEKWHLPHSISEIIKDKHEASSPSRKAVQSSLEIAELCDYASHILSANSSDLDRQEFYVMSCDILGLSQDAAHNFLESASSQVESVALSLGVTISHQASFSDIMASANLQLVKENKSYQELSWALEAAIRERDKYHSILMSEMSKAREIQKSMAPIEINDGSMIFGINHPAMELSGDFFDYFMIDANKLYFCIADVSGKGASASLLMSKTASLFHCLGKTITDPAELLAIINTEIIEKSVFGMFVTMLSGVINTERSEACIINAGHPPAIIVDIDGGAEMHCADYPPLGIVGGMNYKAKKICLKRKFMVAVTDGVSESISEQQLIDACVSSREIASAKDRLNYINSIITNKECGLSDDKTIIATGTF